MMSDAIIEVENLGKKYRLGAKSNERYTALRDVLADTAKALFGWNGPEVSAFSAQGSKDEFWALKDVSFEVKHGEVLGIIGRNGAGKSTLLKILSRITEPSTGKIRIKGRVASLLEVGTGFHPELTGRENIYLNGAILGMARVEIRAKFDEIVAFAEIEKFLDTPVKRYSSGMYVRLAFAVAAHLEPEILVIDEVLAVGDAEFQKKCLGRMGSFASTGRTVLFVSHNMGVVRTLCPSAIVMHAGKIVYHGESHEAIGCYLSQSEEARVISRKPRDDGRPTVISAAIRVMGDVAVPELLVSLKISSRAAASVSIELTLFDSLGTAVGFASAGLLDSQNLLHLSPGVKDVDCRLEIGALARGTYRIAVQLAIPMVEIIDSIGDGISFQFERPPMSGKNRTLEQSWGYGALEIPMSLSQSDN